MRYAEQHLRHVAHRSRREGVVSPDDFRVGPDGRYRNEHGVNYDAVSRARMTFTDAVRSRPTKVVLLVGPPGAGKSTWLAEHREPGALYYDATLTQPDTRRELADEARRHGVPVEAVVFRTTLETCLDRNAARSSDRRVPDERVRDYFYDLQAQPPHAGEGLDAVTEIT